MRNVWHLDWLTIVKNIKSLQESLRKVLSTLQMNESLAFRSWYASHIPVAIVNCRCHRSVRATDRITLPVPASSLRAHSTHTPHSEDTRSTMHEPTFNRLPPACHIYSGICWFQTLSAIAP